MRTSKHHNELTDGKGKCSVPMWSGGCPAGFCDKDAFGKQQPDPYGLKQAYCSGLACPAHGGPSCSGIEIESGVFSGCDQSAGDCPTCGK